MATLTASIVAKHRVELLQSDTESVHLASYRAGPETRDFEKAKIKKLLAKNIFKPTQTECAALIVFVPQKGRAPFFA